MKSFNTIRYNYKMTNNKLFVFDKKGFFIKKILLPYGKDLISFHGYCIENTLLKIVFWTNYNYLSIATLNEETFEFSDWGLTK